MNSLFDTESSSALSLSQFTAAITRAVNSDPRLIGAWVMAELSDVRMSGGHCYMELIEKTPSGQTVAKIRATVWQSAFSMLHKKFFAATGRPIATGIKVLVRGNATHHSLYGLSFNITDIDPSYTLGDLERLRREILERLMREGIRDKNKELMLAIAPRRIAVISAEGAAGYGDFINQLNDNDRGYLFYPTLFQAVMQGDRVSASVREALQRVAKNLSSYDCVAILRGGGATTDLNGFDDYELAKSVALFPLPVIVGIGHERDRTVLDEIAHTRVKTPTAAAAFFINCLDQAENRVLNAVSSIMRYASERISGEIVRIANIEAFIPVASASAIKTSSALLSAISTKIPVITEGLIRREAVSLDACQKILQTIINSASAKASARLDAVETSLPKLVDFQFQRHLRQLDSLTGLVDALSPDATLKRGYSITRFNGKAVRDASALKKGDVLITQMAEGEVKSVVE